MEGREPKNKGKSTLWKASIGLHDACGENVEKYVGTARSIGNLQTCAAGKKVIGTYLGKKTGEYSKGRRTGGDWRKGTRARSHNRGGG